MATLRLFSPLAGWALPLAEVPDPVFAGKMAGDGIAIDPTGSVLHAPCDGEVLLMKDAKHALTLRAEGGVDILLHLGIDTVEMGGAGFELLVKDGERVRTGDALLRFDLDRIARKAKSCVTPILIASAGTIVRRMENATVTLGDVVMEVAHEGVAAVVPVGEGVEVLRRFSVPFDHGLHARPAALLVAALRPYSADVAIMARGRNGNARSTVALMSLGVRCGEVIEVRAMGADADAAVEALEALLAPAPDEPVPVEEEVEEVPGRLSGVIASRGFAMGPAVVLVRKAIEVEETGRSEAVERARLSEAISRVSARLGALHGAAAGEQRAILAAHIELLQDPDLADRAASALRRGKSAGYAWRESTRGTIQALGELDDERMRERGADLRDLEDQVLRVLAGEEPDVMRALPENAIVVADEILPSQLLSLDLARVAGISMAGGGPTSHVAIIAAARGIPTLVATGRAVLRVAEGTPLVLDAERGSLDVDPSPAERAELLASLEEYAERRKRDLAAALEPAFTQDKVRIEVHANLGALSEAAPALAFGAEGCGLLRTEFLFLERREPPTEDEQAREYQAIADAMQGRCLTIRTLDIGGDKPIPYLPLPREENPALGLRGLRTSLWRPELLRTQLRAILRVKSETKLRIMLPMVTDVDDLLAARTVLDECAKELGIEATPELGVMIETPASALLADQLAPEADFFSLGTNDLSQYALAMDRGHPELAGKLDALHPAVLRLIAITVDAGHLHGCHVGVCGGLASDAAALPILVGLGVREISAVPAAIPRLKSAVRSLDAAICEKLAHRALGLGTAQAVRAMLRGE